MAFFKKRGADSRKDTSRISITAHHTGYTWYANDLSHKAFATLPGGILYYSTKPWMFFGRTVLGISDLETSLLQRHIIIDHLLDQVVREHGVTQVLELACGLSPRGFRFKQRHGSKDILYIEADLLPMAKRKKALLEQAGLLGENHVVVPCNILLEHGEHSLESVAKKYLDPARPTVIITEGIINYFDLEIIKGLWSRINAILRSFSGGIYIADNMPHHSGHIIKIWNRVVSMIARGGFYMHFHSDQEAEHTFKSLGFDEIRIYQPEFFRDKLPVISFGRRPSFLRVIKARVTGR